MGPLKSMPKIKNLSHKRLDIIYNILYLIKIRGIIRLVVNYSNMRDNFKDYCDKVTDDYETVIVTRKNGKNVVMISLEEYNNMKENLYIMSNKKDYDRLVTSKKQLEAGKGTVAKSIEELRQLEDE